MQEFADVVIPISIAIISFSIGFSLHFHDFRRIITHPIPMIVGLLCQLLLLPLLAFIIAFFWPIDPLFKVGLILIAACPGGTMSNFITYLLKGRVALSVSLTAFNSLLIIITIPLYIQFASDYFLGQSSEIDLSFEETMGKVFFTVILPTTIGLVINELSPSKFQKKVSGFLRYLIWIMLAVSVSFVLFSGNGAGPKELLQSLYLIFPLLILNVLSILMGFYIAKWPMLKMDHKSAYTISIEVGLQNSVLAIFIAAQLLKEPVMAIVPALYGGFSLFTTWGLAWILKVYLSKEEKL